MPLAGKQISYGWALALTYDVGFRNRDQTIAVALMCAESGRYCGAWHDNLDPETGEVSSTDRGLFQINDYWHKDLTDDEAYSAIPNTEYAFGMSNGHNFQAWAAYNSNAHLKFIPLVWAVKSLGKWKKKVPFVEERFPRDERTV